MRDPLGRWTPPPLSPCANRRERERNRLEQLVLQQQIRSVWTAFCSRADLIERLGPTTAETWTPPTIGPITLGPPTRFSVRLRPGQLRADLDAVRDRLAAAYEVDDAIVRDLARSWVTVELVEHGVGEPAAGSTPQVHRGEPAPRRGGVRRTGPHLPPRDRRGPFGRPRRLGR